MNHDRIRRACPSDIDVVTEILADGLLDGDLGPWLVPDADHRRRIYGAYFEIFAEHFLQYGTVDIDVDLNAVVLWIRVGDQFSVDIPDYATLLARATRDAVGRFVALDRAMRTAHPAGMPHEYLAFLAVRQGLRGRGQGSLLMRQHHARLDADGTPAYLVATGDRSAALYARHGYRPGRPPYTAEDSPPLRPMWRPPFPGRTADHASRTGAGRSQA